MYQTTNVFVFVSIKGLRTVKTWHRSNNVINASATATFFPLSRRRAKRRDRHKPQSNPLWPFVAEGHRKLCGIFDIGWVKREVKFRATLFEWPIRQEAHHWSRAAIGYECKPPVCQNAATGVGGCTYDVHIGSNGQAPPMQISWQTRWWHSRKKNAYF